MRNAYFWCVFSYIWELRQSVKVNPRLKWQILYRILYTIIVSYCDVYFIVPCIRVKYIGSLSPLRHRDVSQDISPNTARPEN